MAHREVAKHENQNRYSSHEQQKPSRKNHPEISLGSRPEALNDPSLYTRPRVRHPLRDFLLNRQIGSRTDCWREQVISHAISKHVAQILPAKAKPPPQRRHVSTPVTSATWRPS